MSAGAVALRGFDEMDAESVQEQLRAIEKDMGRLSNTQEAISDRMRVIESWITERKRSIDSTEDRFHMLEQDVDRHQSWMDQRTGRWEGQKLTWDRIVVIVGILLAAAGGVVQILALFVKKS